MLAYISLGMAREFEQYERTVYSFLDMGGFLGGIYDSLLFIGFMFASLSQTKLFDFKLISKLYQLSDSPDDSSSCSNSYPIENDANYFISSEPSQEEPEIEEEKQPVQSAERSKLSSDDRFGIPRVSSLNNEDSIPEPDDEKLSAIVLTDLSNELSNRRSIKYKWYDVYPNIKFLLSCKKYKNSSYASTQQIYK